MRAYTFVATIAIGLCLLTSCKKNEELSNEKNSGEEKIVSVSNGTGWMKLPDWSTQSENGHFLYNAEIQDPLITKEVIEEGLLLIYQQSSGKLLQLPYSEDQAKATNWFYQVFEGKISIVAESSIAINDMAVKSFQYFVITPEKLLSLKDNGYSKNDLLQLGYDGLMKVL